MIDGVKSTQKNIVSQGSILGPLLYVFYTAPVADIIRSHGLGFHFYSDDTQLYLAFVQTTPDQQVSLAWIEHSVKEIDTWMLCNTLKPNGKKTELLVLSAQHRPRPEINQLHVSFKVLNDLSPQYSSDILQHYPTSRTLRSVTKKSTFSTITQPGPVWQTFILLHRPHTLEWAWKLRCSYLGLIYVSCILYYFWSCRALWAQGYSAK